MTGQEFKAALKALGLSQRRFAAKIGVEPNTVNRWAVDAVPVPSVVVEYLRVLTLAQRMLQ